MELKVEDTWWRSKTSNKGAHYQNQINSVYFSVPNYLLEKYGKLQRIKAEWYEYKTQDIVVTSDQKAYDSISPWIGKATNADNCDRGFVENCVVAGSPSIETHDWAYNAYSHGWSSPVAAMERAEILYYLFKTNDISSYDPYATETSYGGISSNELYDYILSYDKSFNNGKVKDGMISADLFEKDIDDYRKVDNEFGKIQYGYSFYDFDADADIFDIKAYKPGDHSFAENRKIYKFWDVLFGRMSQEESDYSGLSPILILSEDDFVGTDEEISKRLFVNVNEVDDLKEYFKESVNNDKSVVLFRFANTDYYSAPVDVFCNDFAQGHYDGLAYRAWQSVFLDFDVIQLTFSNNDVLTVIPAVSNPIDIIAPITPPTHFPVSLMWLWIACGIVAVCVIGIVVYRHVKKEA